MVRLTFQRRYTCAGSSNSMQQEWSRRQLPWAAAAEAEAATTAGALEAGAAEVTVATTAPAIEASNSDRRRSLDRDDWAAAVVAL